VVEHDIRMPVSRHDREVKGDLDWRRGNRPSLPNLLANPIYPASTLIAHGRLTAGARSRGTQAPGGVRPVTKAPKSSCRAACRRKSAGSTSSALRPPIRSDRLGAGRQRDAARAGDLISVRVADDGLAER